MRNIKTKRKDYLFTLLAKHSNYALVRVRKLNVWYSDRNCKVSNKYFQEAFVNIRSLNLRSAESSKGISGLCQSPGLNDDTSNFFVSFNKFGVFGVFTDLRVFDRFGVFEIPSPLNKKN